MSELREMTVQELAEIRARHPSEILLLDIREPHELEVARLSDVLHIPLNDVPGRAAELPRDKDIVIMCHHGRRSGRLCAYLMEQGFTNVVNLRGGIDAYALEVDPAVGVY